MLFRSVQKTSAPRTWLTPLNTSPVHPPVNASRHPSRADVHHSGPVRLATPYTVADFHRLPSAGLPAHPDHPISGHPAQCGNRHTQPLGVPKRLAELQRLNCIAGKKSSSHVSRNGHVLDRTQRFRREVLATALSKGVSVPNKTRSGPKNFNAISRTLGSYPKAAVSQ